MEDFTNLIGNFGFPIVLVIYLFVRFEKLISEITRSLEQVKQLIQEDRKQKKE